MRWFDRRSRSIRRHYSERGYCICRDVLPVAVVEELAGLADSLITPFEGDMLRQDGKPAPHAFFEGTRLIANSALQLHLPMLKEMRPVADTLRALFAAPTLADSLQGLDGARHYTIHQVIYFFAAQANPLHFDAWGLDTVPRGFAHTLWIPLQDMEHTSGVPAVVPWPVGKVLSDAELGVERGELPVGFPDDYATRHQAAWERAIYAARPELVTAPVRKGDLMVWTSLSPHLTMPSRVFPTRRLSLQVLLRPTDMPHGFFYYQPRERHPVHSLPVSDRMAYAVGEDIAQAYGIETVVQ